jgi:hypothetical protein
LLVTGHWPPVELDGRSLRREHSPQELKDRVLSFQTHYQQSAEPFKWTFTRAKLLDLTRRLQADGRLAAAA